MATNPIELGVPLPDILEEVDGEYRVKGSRITLYSFVSAIHNGIAPYAMVFYYTSLSFQDIRKVYEFYETNRAAVEDFVGRYQAAIDRLRATGKTYDREELRRRYEAKMASRAAPASVPAPRPADPATPAGVP